VLPPDYHAARTWHWGIHPTDTRSLDFARTLQEKECCISMETFRGPERPLGDTALRAILAACDVFSPNWHEAVRIVGTDDYAALVARFHDLGGRILALRRGADGADVWNLAEGRGVHVPAIPVNVVDPVGAGNAFCGAFVARLEDGISAAACHASTAASYLIEQVGLPPALPDPAEYARRLNYAQAELKPLALAEIQ
jgi:sugar/nucleoside kinase (ribokinase family)